MNSRGSSPLTGTRRANGKTRSAWNSCLGKWMPISELAKVRIHHVGIREAACEFRCTVCGHEHMSGIELHRTESEFAC